MVTPGTDSRSADLAADLSDQSVGPPKKAGPARQYPRLWYGRLYGSS